MFPLRREDVTHATLHIVLAMPAERRSKLPFVNNRPGAKFFCNFLDSNMEDIRFGNPSKE